MNILLIGHDGQVAWELQRTLACLGSVTALGRSTQPALDLTKSDEIRATLRAIQPKLIVNAAAYTGVDKAEQESEAAFAINAEAPGVMADACFELDIPLIHYSTDYAFDGSKATPYREADTPCPLSVYGASKVAGEQALRISGCDHLILRTSWVYSQYGRNFLLTMQRLLQEREELSVVDDQIGAPTWAGTIAQSTRALIERWQAGDAGADYVAFGAFFPSTTKDIEHRAELDVLTWWRELMEIPCVAIGGITPDNCGPLVEAGADFLAVSGAVCNDLMNVQKQMPRLVRLMDEAPTAWRGGVA